MTTRLCPVCNAEPGWPTIYEIDGVWAWSLCSYCPPLRPMSREDYLRPFDPLLLAKVGPLGRLLASTVISLPPINLVLCRNCVGPRDSGLRDRPVDRGPGDSGLD